MTIFGFAMLAFVFLKLLLLNYQLEKKGNFGFVSKKGKPAQITQNKARHCGLKLHRWCADEFQKKEEKKIKDNIRDKIAGKKL